MFIDLPCDSCCRSERRLDLLAPPTYFGFAAPVDDTLTSTSDQASTREGIRSVLEGEERRLRNRADNWVRAAHDAEECGPPMRVAEFTQASVSGDEELPSRTACNFEPAQVKDTVAAICIRCDATERTIAEYTADPNSSRFRIRPWMSDTLWHAPAMSRQPTAAKIERNAVKIYDETGAYMSCVSFGSEKVTGAVVNGNTLAVNFETGRIKVYTVGPGHSPIYRFTR